MSALPATLLSALFISITIGALISWVPLPYAVMSPGPATNVLGTVDGRPLVEVKGATTYPTSGSLDFTTVSVAGGPDYRVNIYNVLVAWLRSSEEVLPEEQVFPANATQEDVEAEGAAEMASSQQIAAATALRAIGQEVKEHLVIAGIPAGSPAEGVFKAGDVLVSVDGVEAVDATAVRAAVQKHKPGERVVVIVKRDDKQITLEATTGESDGRTVLGVSLGIGYDLPIEVTVHAGNVGGPSAGLMFSLAIYDVLTPGSLVGGKNIAGTGTMEQGGVVGAIGGIRQKVVGAHDAGAEWFLTPTANCEELIGHVPDGMTAVRVGNFQEARNAVQAIGVGQTSSLTTCG